MKKILIALIAKIKENVVTAIRLLKFTASACSRSVGLGTKIRTSTFATKSFSCVSWLIYSSVFLLVLLSQSNLLADTAQAPYQHIPQEYRDYFYNVLTPAIRERCSVTKTNTPSVSGWYDPGDTIIKEGAEDWKDKAALIKGKNNNVYFRDTNGNGIWDSGEYIWNDVNGNQEFDYGTDIVIAGSPISANTGLWGKQNGLYYCDANNNNNWDDGETLWVDNSTGIISDISTFHNTVTSLIPQFVNCNDHGGDWTGQTGVPNWNTAPSGTNSILAYLKEIRIAPTDIDMLSAWYFQQHKILNMLMWIKPIIFPIDGGDKFLLGYNSWESLLSDFILMDWSPQDPYSVYIYAGYNFSYGDPGWNGPEGYFIHALRQRYEWTKTIPHSVNSYISMGGYGGYWQQNFIPVGRILEENKYYNIYNGNESLTHCFYSLNDSDFNSYPEMHYGDNSGVWSQHSSLSPGIPTVNINVLKFDGPNGFHHLTEPPTTEFPVTTPEAFLNTYEDTNRDDLVDVGTDIDSFGADMGTAVFDPQHSEPQIFIPLAANQWDQLPVHAYFVQGGYNYTEFSYDYNFWTQANIEEAGVLQAYSLHSRTRLNSLIISSDKHVKRIDVIRPRGNAVTFDFAWDGNAFSTIGYPVGINEKRTYVLRDITPVDEADLEFELYFDSGVIHHFNSYNSGFIDKVSHIDGRETLITYSVYDDAGTVGTGVTIDFINSKITSPRYDAVIEWDKGHIASVKYTSKIIDTSTNEKKTVTSELIYDDENKKIVGLTNSEFPELSFSIENNLITFGSGNTLAKGENDITFSPNGGAPVTTSTVLNQNGLATSTSITANGGLATTSYEYIASTERYANGSPKWGKVSKITPANGYSEEYEYYADTGWLAKAISTYAGMAKAVEYGYESHGDANYIVERPRKVEEKISGIRTALSLFAYNGASTTETRSLDSSKTLTYTSTRNAYGPPNRTTPTGYYSYSSTLTGNNLRVTLVTPAHWVRQEISPFGSFLTSETKRDDIRVALDVTETCDSFGRPLKITHLDGSSAEYMNYVYHGPKSLVKRLNGLLEDTAEYTYDSIGRPVNVKSDTQTLNYTYDALGNTTSVTTTTRDGAITHGSTYDAQGRITSDSDSVGTTNYVYDGNAVTSTNPEGKTVVTDKYSDGTLKSIGGTAAVPVSYTYTIDPVKGFCVTETRGTTLTKSFRNLLGQTYRTENSTGYWVQINFDPQGRTSGSVDSKGRTSALDYNAKNEITQQTVNGVVTGFTNTVTQKNGKDVFRKTSTVHNSTGNILSVNESAVTGWEQWQTVNGRTTQVSSTPKGGGIYTVATKDFEGITSTEEISRNENTKKIQDGNITLAEVTSKYDDLGRTVSTQDSRKPNGSTFTYRPKTDQVASVFSSDGSKSSYKYSVGKHAPSAFIPTGETKPLGLKYTDKGALEKIIGSSVFDASNIYDDLNRQTGLNTKGDAGDALTSLVYDESNSKLKEKWIAGQKCYEFDYEPDGRMKTFKKTVNGSEAVKTVEYTSAPNFFNSGYSWSNGTPAVTISGHDSFGQPRTIETNGVCTQTFTRNSDSQITEVKFASNLTGDNNISYQYQNLRRSQMTSGDDVISYTYKSGRLETLSSGNIKATYAYEPDSLNLIKTITIEKGGTVALIRNISWQTNADRISSVINKSGSDQIYNSFAYAYNPKGKIAKIAKDDNSEWRYEYDERGQLGNAARYRTDVKLTGNEFAYLADSIGNIRESGKRKKDGSKSVQFTPTLFNTINTRFVGDKLEVSGSAIPEATISVNNVKASRKSNEFIATVDANNADSAVSLQLNVVGTYFDQTETPEVGGAQLGNAPGADVVSTVTGKALIPKSSENPVYDLGGRLISTSLWNYTWNSEDRLISVESCLGTEAQRHKVEFAYDHAGRRIKKSVFQKSSPTDNWSSITDHFFYYDQLLLNGSPADFGLLTNETIISHVTNETTSLQYLWGLDLNGAYQGFGGNGGLLAVIDKTHSKVYLPCSDAKGTIHSYIDADTGNTVAKFAYDPYGKITSSSISDAYSLLPNAFPFTFQSKYYDSELQTYYFGFRYYDPATCRWLNRDPLGESGGLNLYAYCNNDPVNRMDYLGLAGYFFDGTANHPYEINLDGTQNFKTNVRMLFEAYKGNRSYAFGIGSGYHANGTIYTQGERGAGNAFVTQESITGMSMEERVGYMMGELNSNLLAGDNVVDLFGFSRGSANATLFLNKIQEKVNSGDPLYQNINTRFVALIDQVPTKRSIAGQCFGRSLDTLGYAASLTFWSPDTYARNADDFGFSFPTGMNFINKPLHLVSLDEMRKEFACSDIAGARQVGFRGVHSDLGGGYGGSLFEFITREFIIEESKAHNLALFEAKKYMQYDGAYREIYTNYKNNFNKGGLSKMPLLPTDNSLLYYNDNEPRHLPKHMEIHPSVYWFNGTPYNSIY